MRRAPLSGAGLLLLAVHATACAGSFEVVPTDIPRAALGSRVATLDGDTQPMPEHFEAELQLNEDAGRLMRRDCDDKHALWIAGPFVEQAERDGWETTSFATENILEADWGTPRARHAGEQRQPRSDIPVGPHTTLWLRNHEGREAEVPLGVVHSLEVDGKQSPGTKAAWIVPLAVVGAVGVGALVVWATQALERSDGRR